MSSIAIASESSSEKIVVYSVYVSPVPPGVELKLENEGSIYSIAQRSGYVLLMQFSNTGDISFPEYFPGNSYASKTIKIMIINVFEDLLRTNPSISSAGNSKVTIYYLNNADNNKLYVCKEVLVAREKNIEVAFNNEHIPLKAIVKFDINNDGLNDVAIIFDILYSNTNVCGSEAYSRTTIYTLFAGVLFIGIAAVVGFKRFRRIP